MLRCRARAYYWAYLSALHHRAAQPEKAPQLDTIAEQSVMVDWLSAPLIVGAGVALALLVRRRLRQKSTTLAFSRQADSVINRAESPLLRELLPSLAQELWDLLMTHGEPELADQVLDSRIVDRCRCGDDFCATFYVQPKPKGAYGPNHRNISLESTQGMLVLDVVADRNAAIEVLYREEVRKILQVALP